MDQQQRNFDLIDRNELCCVACAGEQGRVLSRSAALYPSHMHEPVDVGSRTVVVDPPRFLAPPPLAPPGIDAVVFSADQPTASSVITLNGPPPSLHRPPPPHSIPPLGPPPLPRPSLQAPPLPQGLTLLPPGVGHMAVGGPATIVAGTPAPPTYPLAGINATQTHCVVFLNLFFSAVVIIQYPMLVFRKTGYKYC